MSIEIKDPKGFQERMAKFASGMAEKIKKIDARDKKLAEKNGPCPYNFSLDPYEYDQYLKFKKKHRKYCKFTPTKDNPFPTGAAGGATSLEFTLTGIGVAVIVKCACGVEENITNYDVW